MSPPPENETSHNSGNHGTIKVMLVDDSAIIRGLLARTLEKDKEIQIVSSVHNGHAAVDAVKRTDPDVIVLDIEMPVMDGITAIPLLLAEKPDVKILMCSTLSRKGASISMQALALGATECLVKPTSNSEIGGSQHFQESLLRFIKSVGRRARPVNRTTPAQTVAGAKPEHVFSLRSRASAYSARPAIVAIGSSTGGPQALFEVLKHISGIQVPVIVTQHMPKTFTALLAEHIQSKCGVPCHEGAEGMILENGHIYIAPGDYHMEFMRNRNNIAITLSTAPPENFCRPSVEPMMRSIIGIYGEKVLGVMLTGMGQDGIHSFKQLAQKGGNIIAQDEKTSIVWGMPGAVAIAGLCTKVLPLNEIGPWLRKNVIEI